MKRWVLITLMHAAGLILSAQAVAEPTERAGMLTLATPAIVRELEADCATMAEPADDSRGPASAQCLRYASGNLVRVMPNARRYAAPRSEDVNSAFELGWPQALAAANGMNPAQDGVSTTGTTGANELHSTCKGSRPDRKLCGIHNAEGAIVVPLKFDEVRPNAQSDVQAVRFDKRWGYYSISRRRLIVVPQFIQVGDFSGGSAFVETSDTPPRTWIVDENGNRKSELPTGTHISGATAEGLSSMKLDGRFGYIDARGTVAIEPQFLRATPFSGGHAFVQFSEQPAQYALIDRQGRGLVFFEVADTSFLPVGRDEFLAFSDCSRQRGCVARCVSIAEIPESVSIQSTCLAPQKKRSGR